MINNLKLIRTKLKLTTEEVAELTSLSVGTVNKLENGGMKLTSDYIHLFAEKLEVDPADIIDPNYSPQGAVEKKNPLEMAARDPLLIKVQSIFYKTWFLSEYGKIIPIEDIPPLVYSLYSRMKEEEKQPNDNEIKTRATDIFEGIATSRRT